MREILFKAKRLDNGEWVEGTPVNPRCQPGKCYMMFDVIGMDERYGYGNNGKVCLNHYAVEVIPETVCQYIGLSDTNGIKIFEGDIFRIPGRAGCSLDTVVEYDENFAGFIPFADYDCDCDIYTYPTDGFVAGNIHDEEVSHG